MTQEEILEYNKRCAEFLKWEFTTFKEVYNHINDFKGNQYDSLEELQFHSDWNWIMEVVEAIEKLYDHPNKEISVDIRAGQIEIFQRPYRLEDNDYHELIYLDDGYINNSKKEAVVKAINQFLIWYNENNK